MTIPRVFGGVSDLFMKESFVEKEDHFSKKHIRIFFSSTSE